MAIGSLSASVRAQIGWTASNSLTGSEYGTNTNSTTIQKTLSIGTSIANAVAGGGDEPGEWAGGPLRPLPAPCPGSAGAASGGGAPPLPAGPVPPWSQNWGGPGAPGARVRPWRDA